MSQIAIIQTDPDVPAGVIAELLAEVAGGTVTSNCCGEKGLVEVGLTGAGEVDPLFTGVDGRFRAFQWHNDSFSILTGARHLATSTDCPGQAFLIGSAWGLQFHPEVNAAIVGDWSRRAATGTRYLEPFASAEAAHRELCRLLLANFLAVTGLRDC